MRSILAGIIALIFSVSVHARCVIGDPTSSCAVDAINEALQNSQQRRQEVWDIINSGPAPTQTPAWEIWDMPTRSYDQGWTQTPPPIQPPSSPTPAQTRDSLGRQPCQVWHHGGYADPDLSISVYDRACFD